jgi:hypothetical protein
MDIKSIKTLAEKYSSEELKNFADQFEASGVAPIKTQEDAGEQMSDYLMAAELKHYLDQGLPMNKAVREFSKRVRGVLI